MKRSISLSAIIMLLAAAAVTAAGCGGSNEIDEAGYPAFTLTSPVFTDGDRIPDIYTCTGDDVSPSLEWLDAPEETRSFVLIVNDPDAPGGDFIHWVVYNIPAETAGLPEDVPEGLIGESGIAQGENGFGNAGYGGPCPPSGTHRYYFKLYALDTMLDVTAGAAASDIRGAMEGHVLAEAVLIGTYSR